jgi:hypothetical protein
MEAKKNPVKSQKKLFVLQAVQEHTLAPLSMEKPLCPRKKN